MSRLVQAENLEQMIHLQTQAEVDGWDSKSRETNGFGIMLVSRCVEVDDKTISLDWLRVPVGLVSVDIVPLHTTVDKRNPSLKAGYVAIHAGGLQLSDGIHNITQLPHGFQLKSYKLPDDEDILIDYSTALRVIEPVKSSQKYLHSEYKPLQRKEGSLPIARYRSEDALETLGSNGRIAEHSASESYL